MAKDKLLKEYLNSVDQLKKESAGAGISEEEFKKAYTDSLNDIDDNYVIVPNQHRRIYKNYKMIAIFIAIIILILNYKLFYSCFICNMQEYIYPGLRLLRKLSIPIISLFPSLTELYQETCLIQNPFFTVVDMDCWPCSSVTNIGEMFNPQPDNKQQNAPFIYKMEQFKKNVDDLRELYIKNKKIFDKESPKVLVNNNHYVTPDYMFNIESLEKNLFVWKLNSFNVARTLRQLIPRPKVVPKFGQSTERFIIIDSRRDKFNIPDTECNFAFLLVLSGTRIIDLQPADECKHQCKSFKMELRESYLLWYNWWYWRPIIQQSLNNETFVAHVGSYC